MLSNNGFVIPIIGEIGVPSSPLLLLGVPFTLLVMMLRSGIWSSSPTSLILPPSGSTCSSSPSPSPSPSLFSSLLIPPLLLTTELENLNGLGDAPDSDEEYDDICAEVNEGGGSAEDWLGAGTGRGDSLDRTVGIVRGYMPGVDVDEDASL